MSLAEGVSARVAYKAYASGDITANALAISSVDPAASGGQILRRTQTSLKLQVDTYQSNEERSDRQIADFRHGGRSVTGSVSGEYSPATYFDLFEAALRTARANAITASQSDFTSVSMDNASGTIILGGGDPVAKGFKVGMPVSFTGLADDNNNGVTFIIVGFGGSNNRTISVFPKPETMTADTSFAMTQRGKSLSMPSSGFVKRKFAFEEYHEDIDFARLFTECRIGGFNLGLPATGMSTVEFPVMGRNMELYDGIDGRPSGPFFTDPAAETTTGIFAAVNGLLRVGGSTVGVVTGLTLQAALNPTTTPVVGQNFAPEIFLGRLNLTGQITAQLQDGTYIQNFLNEDEIDILAYLTTTNDPLAPAQTIYVPRVKLGDADVPLNGDGAQTLTMPFQALRYQGDGAGIVSSTIQICDTEITE